MQNKLTVNSSNGFSKTAFAILLLLTLTLASCGGKTPATQPPPPPTIAATAAPTGPSFFILGAVNRDTTQAAQTESLTLDNTNNLLVAWAENASGDVRQVFASKLAGDAFQPLGASINIHTNVVAESPSITTAGENNAVPWVSWYEPSPGFGNVTQIFASRFNAETGLWQQAGQNRGGGEASININTKKNAENPFIFGGSTELGKPPAPWVTWEEVSSGSTKASQIFVARGIKDDTGDANLLGGFSWQTVGQVKVDGESTLNVDHFRTSLHPSGVFAETGNSVPWILWEETGRDRPSRLFTARGVVDANSPGGFKWINVPPCDPKDETTCALNINPTKDAKDAAMVSGSVTPGESSVPWLVWPEVGPTGKWQIFVSRLDTNTRNGFLQVGGSLNVDPNHDGRNPKIVFAGNVPYVTWLEDDGTGKFVIQLRHLGSDPQTGTWVLDTPQKGFNLDARLSDFDLAASATSDTIFLAWGEGDPTSAATQMIIGAFKPGTTP